MNERRYQAELIRKLHAMFPGCSVMKNDPKWRQGVPDLLVLYGRTWAMLEVKMDANSAVQPNQEYYIDHYGAMSFAAFINPGNEKEVLSDLQQTFGLTGEARVS